MLDALPINPQMVVFGGFVIMALTVMIFRMQAMKRPTSVKKILIPPLGMSTGFVMFLYPPVHIPLTWALLAFAAGAIFLAIPLIKTSQFQIIEDDIYLQPSKAFMFLILFLLIVRLVLHSFIEQYISLYQTAGVFFILAFGMLLPWRVAMYFQYKKCRMQLQESQMHTGHVN